MDTLRSLVDFYVTQHNAVMPHAAFDGATPDEVFSGTAGRLGARLAHARGQARQRRLEHNRSRSCETCAPAELQSDHEGVAVASSKPVPRVLCGIQTAVLLCCFMERKTEHTGSGF